MRPDQYFLLLYDSKFFKYLSFDIILNAVSLVGASYLNVFSLPSSETIISKYFKFL